MIWYDDLFVGKRISPRRKKRIIRKVKKRSIWGAEYLLTLSANPDNLIDIINIKVVRQRYYPRRDLVVIGLAGNYEEAQALVIQIVEDSIARTGECNLKDFLCSRSQNEV